MSFLKDKLTGLFRSTSEDEDEAAKVIANREMRRRAQFGQRLKGPGYTRTFRKGRTQRGSDS